MKNILFIEFWNCSPHLETSLELAKHHADAGDQVSFYFCGHDTEYKDGISVRPEDCGLFRKLPEVRGIELIQSERIHFYSRVKLPGVIIQAPEQFETLEALVDFKYETFQAGIGIASSLVSDTKNSNPDLKENHFKINQMIRSSVSVYKFTRSVIKSNSADLVYVFNGRFCNHRAVMCAAQEMGVEVLFHERGANRFLYDVLPFMPHDSMQLQDKIKKNWVANKNNSKAHDLAKSFYLDRKAGLEQGWLSYTNHQQKNFLPEIDKTKKIITYFSSSDDEYASVGDLIKYTGWRGQLEAVKDLIEICKKEKNIQLFIRLHPHMKEKAIEDQNRWLDFNELKNVKIISFNSSVDTYALIDRSDLVITAGSTVGIEATFWGRPSITVGPAFYSELGATYRPQSKEELAALISTAIEPLPKEGALAYGYYMITYGMKFQYYEPETLFKGKFLGVDLQEIPNRRKKWIKFNNLIFKPYRVMKKIMNKLK